MEHESNEEVHTFLQGIPSHKTKFTIPFITQAPRLRVLLWVVPRPLPHQTITFLQPQQTVASTMEANKIPPPEASESPHTQPPDQHRSETAAAITAICGPSTTPSPHHYIVSGDAYSPLHHFRRIPRSVSARWPSSRRCTDRAHMTSTSTSTICIPPVGVDPPNGAAHLRPRAIGKRRPHLRYTPPRKHAVT
mmetsp:Transcript_58976/g.68930  ORF Transcript_58976/g.68930 Transcript_58976/m.68930 type:complete len:192 (+) Transcript_58976:173-748(+)